MRDPKPPAKITVFIFISFYDFIVNQGKEWFFQKSDSQQIDDGTNEEQDNDATKHVKQKARILKMSLNTEDVPIQ